MTNTNNDWREKVKNIFYKWHDLGFEYPEGLRVDVEQMTKQERIQAQIDGEIVGLMKAYTYCDRSDLKQILLEKIEELKQLKDA